MASYTAPRIRITNHDGRYPGCWHEDDGGEPLCHHHALMHPGVDAQGRANLLEPAAAGQIECGHCIRSHFKAA